MFCAANAVSDLLCHTISLSKIKEKQGGLPGNTAQNQAIAQLPSNVQHLSIKS
jgi:hypothetical protein